MKKARDTSNKSHDRLRPPTGGLAAGPGLSFDNEPFAFNHAAELLTTPEVATLLKISVSVVRRLKDQRRIPFIKVGGAVRFTRADVTSFLEHARRERIGP